MLKFWKKKRSTEIRKEKYEIVEKSTDSVLTHFPSFSTFFSISKNTHTHAIDSNYPLIHPTISLIESSRNMAHFLSLVEKSFKLSFQSSIASLS